MATDVQLTDVTEVGQYDLDSTLPQFASSAPSASPEHDHPMGRSSTTLSQEEHESFVRVSAQVQSAVAKALHDLSKAALKRKGDTSKWYSCTRMKSVVVDLGAARILGLLVTLAVLVLALLASREANARLNEATAKLAKAESLIVELKETQASVLALLTSDQVIHLDETQKAVIATVSEAGRQKNETNLALMRLQALRADSLRVAVQTLNQIKNASSFHHTHLTRLGDNIVRSIQDINVSSVTGLAGMASMLTQAAVESVEAIENASSFHNTRLTRLGNNMARSIQDVNASAVAGLLELAVFQTQAAVGNIEVAKLTAVAALQEQNVSSVSAVVAQTHASLSQLAAARMSSVLAVQVANTSAGTNLAVLNATIATALVDQGQAQQLSVASVSQQALYAIQQANASSYALLESRSAAVARLLDAAEGNVTAIRNQVAVLEVSVRLDLCQCATCGPHTLLRAQSLHRSVEIGPVPYATGAYDYLHNFTKPPHTEAFARCLKLTGCSGADFLEEVTIYNGYSGTEGVVVVSKNTSIGVGVYLGPSGSMFQTVYPSLEGIDSNSGFKLFVRMRAAF